MFYVGHFSFDGERPEDSLIPGYPHLAVHPYNLIPLCANCNSWTKGNRDPLGKFGQRRNLEDIWLPYREDGMSSRTKLEISFTSGYRFPRFDAISSASTENLELRIDVLKEVYDLPERWSQRKLEIGDALFRNMRRHSRFFVNTIGAVQKARDLLSYLHLDLKGELALQPFVYPMIWYLGKLIDEELSHEEAPLVAEIRSWD